MATIRDYTVTSRSDVPGHDIADVEVTSKTQSSYAALPTLEECRTALGNNSIQEVSIWGCFYGCTSLTTAPTIPNNITDMSYCFFWCTSLTTAPTIPNNVTDMSHCFRGCTSLTTVPTIPASVKYMESCFNKCTSLQTAPTIPNNVTDISYCFCACTSLTTAPTIPASVTKMSYCFDGCTSLTTAPTIPNNITDMSYCFRGCEKLTGVIKINANPVRYEKCFANTVLPITLIGTSNLKQQIAATANNGNVTIGEPPRCDYTPLSKLTTDWIKSVTIARTTITNSTAYDGAAVSNVRLTIGSATASIPGDGIIDARINDVGTYTPYITITDSNENNRTYTLDPITIQDYSKPTITDISVERVIAPISQDDTQAKITCTIGHRYQISGNKLGVPEVSVNGNDISDEISWYDDSQKQIPYSGNYTGPPKTIYGWVDEDEIFSQDDTYTFTLSIADSYAESDSKTEVLPSIFSTMDFQAGGKEIAFGTKADDDVTEYNNGLFKCGMSILNLPMIGEIKMWAGNTIPQGWLLCDGSEVSKTTYPRLFAAIGNLWGTPSSSSNFKLPNLAGRVPVGINLSDTSFDVVGETGGEKTHTLTTTEIPSHRHSSHYYSSDWCANGTKSGYHGNKDAGTEGNTGYTGGGGAHNNLQPYAVVKYIICAI